jgi:hypothetical protein
LCIPHLNWPGRRCLKRPATAPTAACILQGRTCITFAAIAPVTRGARSPGNVREYEQPQGAEVTLEWHALRALPYEARIGRLARWVDLAERGGRRYRLALPGQPVLGPGHGPHHRHACLRALALMPHG